VGIGGEEKKSSQKKPTKAEESKKKGQLEFVTLVSWGQGGTKKVHPSVHHPSTLVHWWVLVHSGQKRAHHL
jgi:hypothetical protein